MPHVRTNHAAAALPNGKVLVTGGQGNTSATLATTDMYDAVTDTWSSAVNMPHAHRYHTALLLPSGKVLVAGGQDSLATWSASADLYDPSTDSWSPAADMPNRAAHHTATLLPSGQCWSLVEISEGLLRTPRSMTLR